MDSLDSKQNLHCELKYSRIVRRSNNAECASPKGVSRIAKIDIIEDIEELRAELQLCLLSDSEIFRNPQVNVEKARSQECILCNIPEGTDCIGYEQTCIEEFRDHLTMRSIAQYDLLEVRAGEIRAVFANSAIRVIATAKEGERKAALPGHNGSYGPAAQQIPANAAQGRMRHLPDLTEVEDVRNIINGVPVVKTAVIRISLEIFGRIKIIQ